MMRPGGFPGETTVHKRLLIASMAELVIAPDFQSGGRPFESDLMLMNTNTKGRIAELIAQAKFIELGYTVLSPINKDGIYDFVIEMNNVFKKVQVKTLTDKGDYYLLRTRSVNTNSKGFTYKHYSENEIDYFVGVDLITKEVFKVPFEKSNKASLNLRKIKPKNNQVNNIVYSQEYLLK